MKLFNKKEKKNKGTGNDIINQLALQEALRELKEQKDINHQLSVKMLVLEEKNEETTKLETNLQTLISTNERIKAICKASKTSKVAKAILKELGE